MKKIAGLLEKRTEEIMNANRRNYYGEYTVYIAYKNAYSGRSAFREEMRRYGGIDVKGK